MGDQWPPGPPYVSWADLERHREQESQSRHLAEERMAIRVEKVEGRVDRLESSLDQLRGAKALIYFLVGSNLLLVVSILLGLAKGS